MWRQRTAILLKAARPCYTGGMDILRKLFPQKTPVPYDAEKKVPVLRCSICTGEQVAGFKDKQSGAFEEITLIRNERELRDFMRLYGIKAISREY